MIYWDIYDTNTPFRKEVFRQMLRGVLNSQSFSVVDIDGKVKVLRNYSEWNRIVREYQLFLN